MQSRDGRQGFDFTGTYTKVRENELIEYIMDDGRNVSVGFQSAGGGKTRVTERFDPEKENSEEMQRKGWQSILDNFRKYAEAN